MLQPVLTLAVLCVAVAAPAQQQPDRLIALATAYTSYMVADPPQQVLDKLQASFPGGPGTAEGFILHAIAKGNHLLTSTWLSRPEDSVLHVLYIIHTLSNKTGPANASGNERLTDSLLHKAIPVYLLVDNYYNMLFTAVGYKDRPFNLTFFNLQPDAYGLRDNTEKGILFLRCMQLCNSRIHDLMQKDPPDTKTAFGNIRMFPTCNGRPYYSYLDLDIAEFELPPDARQPPVSYKSSQLEIYYETLVYHLWCLIKEDGAVAERNDLLTGSLLRATSLYRYSRFNTMLEELFRGRILVLLFRQQPG